MKLHTVKVEACYVWRDWQRGASFMTRFGRDAPNFVQSKIHEKHGSVYNIATYIIID